jgi:lysozyme family protein
LELPLALEWEQEEDENAAAATAVKSTIVAAPTPEPSQPVAAAPVSSAASALPELSLMLLRGSVLSYLASWQMKNRTTWWSKVK